MFVGEKLLSIVYNEYFTGGINVLKLRITLFINREDVYKLAVKLFVNREDEEGAPSESGRTGAYRYLPTPLADISNGKTHLISL